MMGPRQVEQGVLFYNFSLDGHVPADHLLRSIDRFVDLSELRRELAPFYSTLGRPSIDPELMIRMLIVGYCFGIRSERRLCEEVHLNLAYRWFCRLGLDGDVPDHSTFSKNRHGRFRQSDLLRCVFETVLQRCIAEGLVGGEAFAVDAIMPTPSVDGRILRIVNHDQFGAVDHHLEARLNRHPRPGDASLRNALAIEHDVDLVAPGFAHACWHVLKTGLLRHDNLSSPVFCPMLDGGEEGDNCANYRLFPSSRGPVAGPRGA